MRYRLTIDICSSGQAMCRCIIVTVALEISVYSGKYPADYFLPYSYVIHDLTVGPISWIFINIPDIQGGL